MIQYVHTSMYFISMNALEAHVGQAIADGHKIAHISHTYDASFEKYPYHLILICERSA